ncbi:E3 ubiquitin-protein ligase TRIM39 [Clinocottus analis]|uniref:E3 ubiquitin-protein ligase TRIM39 n=1 Tax=Clinocottus analis TaxID=304258 RepID=UPI0035BEC1FA
MEHPDALALALSCPICLQLFSEPASLPCGHVYCLACLQTMGEGLDQHSCPECQAEYPGTSALVKSLRMSSMVETYRAAAAGEVASTGHASDEGHAALRGADGCVTAESHTQQHRDAAGPSLGSTEPPSPLDREQGELKMAEPKFRMASQVTELSLKLEMAESALRKEKERDVEVTAANGQLRAKAQGLLRQMAELSQSYAAQVLRLIDQELRPGEASGAARVAEAAELTKRLRRAMLRAESLLTEDDEAAFRDELRTLQPHIAELLAAPAGDEDDRAEPKLDPARACPELERMNGEFRERSGEIQRSLRNALNPSEVTFDPETAHPNLVLSGDLKTVTFSAAKQPYPTSPRRFTNFLQVLSSQSFHEGEHRWEAELEGSPWIFGVCYSAALARSGLPSALESSRCSWCLMWFNNQLTAFERGHDVPLKKTTVSCRLQVRLSFKTHRLSFYNVSAVSGTSHVYTFKARLTEPVHLAYRMMSGSAKGRVTVHS